MSEGNVVGLDTFRAARIARELERHFGLPEGVAEVSADFWSQRHELYAFAKTGGPAIPVETVLCDISTPQGLYDLRAALRDGRRPIIVVPSPSPRD